MRPLLVSTLAAEGIRALAESTYGEDIRLDPSHITRESSVFMVLSAQYFAGTLSATGEYEVDRIVCGSLPSTYHEESEVDWGELGESWSTQKGLTAEAATSARAAASKTGCRRSDRPRLD